MYKIPNNVKVFTKFLKAPKDGSVRIGVVGKNKVYPNPEFFPSEMPNLNDEFTGFDAKIIIMAPDDIKYEIEMKARKATGIIKKHLIKPKLFTMDDFKYIVLSSEHFILK